MDTDLFFGLHIDPLSLGGKTIVVLLAALLGGLIGFERQWRGYAAGLRTHMLVCVGATVMTLTSVEIGMGVRGGMRGDPAHLAAQIVSGIGFLGAGAILREGNTVHGLTTAASIWTTAGIGIALGASPHLGELALIATLVVLVTLSLLGWMERSMKWRQQIRALEVEVQEAGENAAQVLTLLQEQGLTVYGVESQSGSAALTKPAMQPTRQMRLRVQLPENFDRTRFNARLLAEPTILSFHLD
ncbi:MAG TPA: MgtC/SapB family protein [Chthonomonadaceae bacterium]|nr:MgtC/SapB family protein [Chthonomonadaceae bacterium]